MSNYGDDFNHKMKRDASDDELDDEDVAILNSFEFDQPNRGHIVPKEERMSMPYLTKYEKARILGTRALQISNNSPLMTTTDKVIDAYEIAELELKQGVIPLKIRRVMPDGRIEIWSLKELSMDYLS